MDPVNVSLQAKLEVRIALSVPEIIADMQKLWAVLGHAVQGHPRSLILVPIESAYNTMRSYYSPYRAVALVRSI